MVIFIEILVLLMTVLWLKWRKVQHPFLYVGLLILSCLVNRFYIGSFLPDFTWFLWDFVTLFIVVILGMVFFVVDFIVLNMIKKKVLILDFLYILKGKLQWRVFLLSSFIAIFEEILFRYYTLTSEAMPLILLLIISSLSFGLVHIFFSTYDIFSKTVLGFVCGILFLLTDHILFPIVFHVTYNLFASKEKSYSMEVGNLGD